MSLLLIASRHHRYVSQNSILIHNSTTLARHLPAPVEHRLRAFEHGSRIVVRDLFGSMPVRVKQRAKLTSERFYLDREWGQLVADIVAILLAWPSQVSVSLKESVSQREVRLRSPQATDIAARTSGLMAQASMADSADTDDWVPLSASAGHVSVKGCIASYPVATRRAQFISIGILPVTNEQGTNVFYEEINKIFSNSSFGVLEKGSDRKPKDSLVKELKGRKGVDRWPMFYFKIRLRDSSSHNLDEIMDDRNRELATITNLFKAVCYSFLKKHNHRPGKVQLSAQEWGVSTSKALGRAKATPLKRTLSAMETQPSGSSVMHTGERSIGNESPFDGWQRVKVGHTAKKATASKDLRLEQSRPDSTVSEKQRLIGKGGVLMKKPFDDVDDVTEDLTMSSSHFQSPVPTTASTSRECPVRRHEVPSSTTGELSQRQVLAKQPKLEPSEWLKEVIKQWDNPVFENAPLAVRRVYGGAPIPVADSRSATSSSYFVDDPESCGIFFESNAVNVDGRISKAALTHAEVVAQVDLKFILIKLPLNTAAESSIEKIGSTAIVMLDQHAVDERCQLEDLMANYFVRQSDGTMSADVEYLEQPLKYEVREHDAILLTGLRAHFRTWGIVFSIDVKRMSEPKSKRFIKITHLAPSIIQRCVAEPHLLITLLRTEAHSFERPPLPPTSNSSPYPWVTYFHSCPRGILELLHSRACRSAIMFNDVLSIKECEGLVQRVSRCAFPFQCAHGRPTMAPVVDLGMGQGSVKAEGRPVNWKRWMQQETLDR